jgi:hypothetical protein
MVPPPIDQISAITLLEMSRSAEITRLRQEAELLRAVAVEKGVLGHRLDEADWSRVARAVTLPNTTCKYAHLHLLLWLPVNTKIVTDRAGERKAIA